MASCNKNCKGWFVNAETLEIERCDECGIFEDDVAAAKHVESLEDSGTRQTDERDRWHVRPFDDHFGIYDENGMLVFEVSGRPRDSLLRDARIAASAPHMQDALDFCAEFVAKADQIAKATYMSEWAQLVEDARAIIKNALESSAGE